MKCLCSNARCPEHQLQDKPGYCPTCKRERQRQKRARRSYRTKHLSSMRDSAQWQKARAKAKLRDGNACRLCGATDRLEVHHIRPLDKGGAPYHTGNLITLCHDCHAEQGEGAGGRSRTGTAHTSIPQSREKNSGESRGAPLENIEPPALG